MRLRQGPFVLFLLAISFCCLAAAKEKTLHQAEGIVDDIADGQIWTVEFDFLGGEEMNNIYFINSQTKFQNMNSQAEIEEGDDIVIQYVKKKNKRIAVSVSRGFPEDSD